MKSIDQLRTACLVFSVMCSVGVTLLRAESDPPDCGELVVDGPFACGNSAYILDKGELSKSSEVICLGDSASSSVEDEEFGPGDKTQPRHDDCGPKPLTVQLWPSKVVKWYDEDNNVVEMPVTPTETGIHTYTAKIYARAGSSPPVFPRIGSTYCNSSTFNWVVGTYWEPKDNSDPMCLGFLQRPSTSAHAAIQSVIPYRGECLGLMEICIFQAADYALEESQFDTVHPADDLGIGPGSRLAAFVKHQAPRIDASTLVPGDLVYMQNKDDYLDYATGSRLWAGINTVYAGMNGSDVGLFSGMGCINKTEEQLRTELEDGYNEDCDPLEVLDPDTEIRFTGWSRLKTGM